MTTLKNYVRRFGDGSCPLCKGTSFFEPPTMHVLPHLSPTGGANVKNVFQLAALTCTSCGLVMLFDPAVVSAKMR